MRLEWKPGDTCVVITNKKKRQTAEYRIITPNGEYFFVESKTGTKHNLSPHRMFRTRDDALASLPGSTDKTP